MDVNDGFVLSPSAVAQLALHAKLAAHHTAVSGNEPAAAEAILAWAIVVAAGGADCTTAVDAMPTMAEIIESASTLPAYRAAADQAEQLLARFDDEELFELAALYERVVSVIESEIDSVTPHRVAS